MLLKPLSLFICTYITLLASSSLADFNETFKSNEFLGLVSLTHILLVENLTRIFTFHDLIVGVVSLQLQLNAIEADIAKFKGHLKYYRDKKNEMTKKISAMEEDLKTLNEDAEVCGIVLPPLR